MGDRGNAENGENEADGGEGSGVSRRVVGGSGLNVLPEGRGLGLTGPLPTTTRQIHTPKKTHLVGWVAGRSGNVDGTGWMPGGDLYVNVVQNSGDSEQTGFLVLVLARVATGLSPRLCSRWPRRAQAVVWGRPVEKKHTGSKSSIQYKHHVTPAPMPVVPPDYARRHR